MRTYDCLVIGAGHAGIEAAHSAARLGVSVLLITYNLDDIGSSFTHFFMEDVNLEEMKKSLLGQDGRKVII